MALNYLEYRKIVSVHLENNQFKLRFQDLNGSPLRMIFTCAKDDYTPEKQDVIKKAAGKSLWIEHDETGGIQSIRIGKDYIENAANEPEAPPLSL